MNSWMKEAKQKWILVCSNKRWTAQNKIVVFVGAIQAVNVKK